MAVLPSIHVPFVDLETGKVTWQWYQYLMQVSLENQPVKLSSYIDLEEMAVPNAGDTNHARIFAQDSGGKTQLACRFPTGAVQPIVTEP